jgi:uncharacterized protein (TIGR02217 family)
LHKYEIGYGIKDDFDLEEVREMFFRAKGRLHSFNYLDHSDNLSCDPQSTPAATDQNMLGVTSGLFQGDGSETQFQLGKYYVSSDSPLKYSFRKVHKIQTGTTLISLDGTPTLPTASPGSWSVDETTGIVTFDSALGVGVVPKAGFEFYVPVRFDVDYFPVTRIEKGFERVPLTLTEVRL